jgi:hypothetical protein
VLTFGGAGGGTMRRVGHRSPPTPSKPPLLDQFDMKIHVHKVNGCGMGPSHPHDPIQRCHMEAKDLWGPKINMCVPSEGERDKGEGRR